MNSTESPTDSVFLSFYENNFARAARFLSEQSVRLLESEVGKDRATYYVVREKRSMNPIDFEINLENLDEVKQALRKLWAEAETSTLSDLTNKILSLSEYFKETQADEDVSPFIYAMF